MNFREFCINIFKVGCVGFGGGNALVPVLEDTFIKSDSLKETEEDFDRDVIVANLTPGALPVELAAGLGRHNFGLKGMVAGPVIFALPGIAGAVVLFMILSSMQAYALGFINIAAVGVSAFIIALLFEYIRSVLVKAAKRSRRNLFRTIGVILLICVLTCSSTFLSIVSCEKRSFFSVTTINLLVCVFFIAFFIGRNSNPLKLAAACFLSAVFLLGKEGIIFDGDALIGAQVLMVILSLYGLFVSLRGRNCRIEFKGKDFIKDIGIWVLFMAVCSVPALIFMSGSGEFLLRDILSTFMSFGGGDAYLTIADGMFVETGIIPQNVFYSHIITVVNVLPGSILCKTLFGIGFYIGYNATSLMWVGVITGLAGFGCSVAASAIAFFTIYYLYEGISRIDAVLFISEWIRPIVCGLLIKVMLSLVFQSMTFAQSLDRSGFFILGAVIVLAAVNIVIRHRTDISRWLLVIADIAAALLFFAVI